MTLMTYELLLGGAVISIIGVGRVAAGARGCLVIVQFYDMHSYTTN